MIRSTTPVSWVSVFLLGSLLAGICPATARAEKRPPFRDWLAELEREAADRGISRRTLQSALSGLEPIRRVVEKDRNQAEFELTLEQYQKHFLSGNMVSMGRRLREKHAPVLEDVASIYGVAPRYLVAIWGIESRYGRSRPSTPVIAALATLAYDERRSRFFREQLIHALRILDKGDVSPANMKGSWAGAMGQPQFLPSSYLDYAVDFNRDGRRDIWDTEADVFASIANYLVEHGWVEGGGWGGEVTWPPTPKGSIDLPPRTGEGCRAQREMTAMKSLRHWKKQGFRWIDGEAIPASEKTAALVRPDGDARAFLVHENYRILLNYNCAHHYALTVGTLADRIDGDP